jgi:hypothetical protein
MRVRAGASSRDSLPDSELQGSLHIIFARIVFRNWVFF